MEDCPWLRADAPKPTYDADAVFGPSDTNRDVYERVGASVVDAVVRGINGTIMAYGQTSSVRRRRCKLNTTSS